MDKCPPLMTLLNGTRTIITLPFLGYLEISNFLFKVFIFLLISIGVDVFVVDCKHSYSERFQSQKIGFNSDYECFYVYAKFYKDETIVNLVILPYF